MFSWRLLRALITPQRPTALTRRLIFLGMVESAALPRAHGWLRRVMQIAVLIMLPLTAIFFVFPMITLLYLSTLNYAPILLALVNTIFGAVMAGSVAGMIAREHDLRTYDVLASAPDGRFGLHVSYCKSWILAHRLYFWVIVPFVVIGMLGLLMGLGLNAIFRFPDTSGTMLGNVTLRLALMMAFGIDVMHSFAAAAVIGMWMPGEATGRGTARLNAVGGYVIIQFAAYLTLFAFGAILLPLFASMFGGSAAFQIAFGVVMVMCFFLVREAALVLIWREMGSQLNAAPDETNPGSAWSSRYRQVGV
jgi:hypothetical protein